MLSYQNAFAILAGVIFLLAPLVFIMRLPPKRQAPPPEEAMGH
jgi:MFS transporter, DHA2 family, multidrug resistance protein